MTPVNDYISQLIMEKLLQTISVEDDILLGQLMDKNESIRIQYQRTAEQLGRAAEKGIQPPDADESWLQLKQITRRRRQSRRRKYLITAAAAAVILAFFVSRALILQPAEKDGAVVENTATQLQLKLSDGTTIDLANVQNIATKGAKITNDSLTRTVRYRALTKATADPTQLNTLSVPAGKDYNIILPDGTLIKLNSLTQVQFPSAFIGRTREIHINGEAYLKVAHDKNKPFIVHLPGGTVEVLGTEFNINTYNKNEQKVALVEGSLKFSAQRQSLLLTPGQEAVLSGKLLEEHPLNEDDLAWMNGEYIMSNTPIRDLVTLIPAWFGVSVVIDNPTVGSKRFTGIIYKHNSLDDFLAMLKGTMDADYYFRGGILHFK